MRSKVFKVFLRLLCHFGPQRWWPSIWAEGNFRDEVIVGAVLTQGTNWKNVETALRNLEKAGLTDLERLYRTPDTILYELLKPTVYVRRKVRTLRELYDVVYGGYTPPNRDTLLKTYGIGEETADVILLYAYGFPALVIDTYTRRWAERFWGRRFKDDELRRILHRDDIFYLREIHALLDELGKRYCQKFPHCQKCPLKGDCITGVKGWVSENESISS